MSILTAATNKVSPSAAGAAAITSGGGAWTAGSWVEYMASTAAALSITGLTCWSSGASSDMEVEIGVGGVGVEVVVGTVRWYQGNPGAGGPGHLQLPVPLEIASGVRLACRGRSSSAGNDVHAKLQYVEASDNSTTAVLKVSPEHATQNTLTPNASAWANSSWQEVVTGLLDPSGIAGFSIRFGLGEQDYEWDIGIGAAASETVITTLRGTSLTQTSSGNQLSRMMLPFVYLLDATTRVAVRMRKTGTDVTTWNYAMMYYGDLEALDPAEQKLTQLVILVGTDENATEPPAVTPCSGGGVGATGSNPTDGASLATALDLHAWIVITIGATTYYWSDNAINHVVAREPRVADGGWGLSNRALHDELGSFESSSVTIRLLDADNLLRGLHSTQTMRNTNAAVYVATEATIRSGGGQLRFSGIVTHFEPLSGALYEMTLEDPLSLALSAEAQETRLPALLININDGTSDQGLRSAPVPVLYGSLSDEDDSDPKGTIEADFIGTETVVGHADLGNLHKHLICKSATGDVHSVLLADPASGDPPTQRAKAGAGEYGTRIYVPHQAGWFLATEYSVEDAIRYTFLYLDQYHPAADLARYGRVPVTVNVCGREDVGDGTGNTFDAAADIYLHMLDTEWARAIGDEDWPATLTTRAGFSVFNADTFAAVKSRHEDRIAGGYLWAFMLGHSHQQVTLRDVLDQAYISGDIETFCSRLGQVCVTTLDRDSTAAGVPHFTDEQHILIDSFRIDPKADAVENAIIYFYKRNYLRALQQVNPPEGSRLPREPFDADWLSGEQEDTDATSITALGGTPKGRRESRPQYMEFTRHEDTAVDVAAQRLALRKNPNGRAEATFEVPLQSADTLELGDLVKVTHPQGLGSGGWVARRCQVRRIREDWGRMVSELTVRDVDDLLA